MAIKPTSWLSEIRTVRPSPIFTPTAMHSQKGDLYTPEPTLGGLRALNPAAYGVAATAGDKGGDREVGLTGDEQEAGPAPKGGGGSAADRKKEKLEGSWTWT